LAGAFWTNTSDSVQVVVIGGNFSFLPTGASFGSQEMQSLAFYNQDKNTLIGVRDTALNGTVHALLVVGNLLYVGGEFTIPGTSANGFAIYDLSQGKWQVDNVQPLQAASGSSVLVRSVTSTTSNDNIVLVAGSFASAGSLTCNAVCSYHIDSHQWSALGNGIQGNIASVAYAGVSFLLYY
jgi:hypothetical protein